MLIRYTNVVTARTLVRWHKFKIYLKNNSRIYSQVKVHYPYHRHRRQIVHQYRAGVADTGGKFANFRKKLWNDPSGKLRGLGKLIHEKISGQKSRDTVP